MNPQKILFFLLLTSLSIGCSIYTIRPLATFEVAPYARQLDSNFKYGKAIKVVLDPMIQQIQLTQLENGGYSQSLAYHDYRASIEKSIKNMLMGSFEEVSFVKADPKYGLVLNVHRIKPKLRFGELETEHVNSNEFLFDYDMSLSYNGRSIANASGLNAHPTVSYNILKSNWQTASQTSLKLVLEDCYDQLFVQGLAEI